MSLLSEETARKRGIRLEPLERLYVVHLANQTTVRATSCVSSLPLAHGKCTNEVWCLIVPSLTQLLFLGRDWLSRWNPVID